MAQLPDDVDHLGNAGRPNRVAARLQPARQVDRDLPAEFGLPSQGCLAALAFLEKADVLALGDLQDGEGVV